MDPEDGGYQVLRRPDGSPRGTVRLEDKGTDRRGMSSRGDPEAVSDLDRTLFVVYYRVIYKRLIHLSTVGSGHERPNYECRWD